MIIKNIKMENFRSHRNTSINFNKGITSIIGQMEVENRQYFRQ